MANRRLYATIAAAAALSIILLVIPAYGDRSEPTQMQTWPSRTPTSRPNPPPDAGQTPGGGGSGEPASPTPPPSASGQDGTATAVTATAAAATPIATSPTLVSTQLPAGTFLATAEPCGLLPTALAVEAVNVHQGPGDDFEIVGRIRLLAVRPVIGRAAHAPWWLVALENGQAGWIPDRAVIIHGHIGAVEILEAPSVAGQTAEPLQAWNPTPNPICAPAAPIASEANGDASANSQNATAGGESFGGESNAPAVEVSGVSAGDASASEASTNETSTDPESVPDQDQGASLAAGDPEDSGGSLTWVLLIGIVLILGGAIALLLQAFVSRSGSSS